MKYTKHQIHEARECLVKEAIEHMPKLNGKMPQMHKVPKTNYKVMKGGKL